MKLKVYYGLRKLTKKAIRRPSILVIFENTEYHKNQWYVDRAMVVLHTRYQTEGEMEDAKYVNRILSSYEIFLDDKVIKGDPERAILLNFEKDSKNVSEKERLLIADKIREKIYSFYNLKPIDNRQLSLF